MASVSTWMLLAAAVALLAGCSADPVEEPSHEPLGAQVGEQGAAQSPAPPKAVNAPPKKPVKPKPAKTGNPGTIFPPDNGHDGESNKDKHKGEIELE